MHIVGYLKGIDSDHIPDLPDSLMSRADIRRNGEALYVISKGRLNYKTPENKDTLNEFKRDVRQFAHSYGYEVMFDWENAPVLPTKVLAYDYQI